MTHYCCTNCGFWQRRFDVPTWCPVCEDYRHPLPPEGYAFRTTSEVANRQRVTWDEPIDGVTRFGTAPSIGIGSCGYLIESPGGNIHFDGCGWYDDDALTHIESRGGVAYLAASHAHVFGAMWRVAERFAPRVVFQAEALPFCQALSVTLPFDESYALSPGMVLHRTAGHTPDHTVLHDEQNGRLYCGDALKFTFPEPGQTVGRPDTISCHKAYDAHIPLTHGDCRRYLELFERLDFDAVITPWEVVPTGGKAAALDLLHAQLNGDPFADPHPIPTPHA